MPCGSIDRITEFMCRLEFLFYVLPVYIWGRIVR
jgi:hypothetical protein